jgi:hypothetical protein
VSAAKYIERAETVYRIAALVGQNEHSQQLLAVTEDYLRLADAATPDEQQRAQIAALLVQISDRLPDRG